MCAAVCFCVLNASCAIVLVLYAACVVTLVMRLSGPWPRGGGGGQSDRAIPHSPSPGASFLFLVVFSPILFKFNPLLLLPVSY